MKTASAERSSGTRYFWTSRGRGESLSGERHTHRKDVYAVIQVRAEVAVAAKLIQVVVRRADQRRAFGRCLTSSVFAATAEPMRYAGVTMCLVFLGRLGPFAPEIKGVQLPE